MSLTPAVNAIVGDLTATCVIAREVSAPDQGKPIEWRLLTNRAVETLEQAAELIEWYRARWEIEMLFGVFKQAKAQQGS